MRECILRAEFRLRVTRLLVLLQTSPLPQIRPDDLDLPSDDRPEMQKHAATTHH